MTLAQLSLLCTAIGLANHAHVRLDVMQGIRSRSRIVAVVISYLIGVGFFVASIWETFS